ncbi:Flp pilus assembly protein CpaB [Arthrobacter sp. H14-L1]|uniref:Flp pilus assembly protein CpaB n=1 Tax=Arthrobacter sp. H14-L1 TaxID=2996697 RepID=UPI00227211D4|nr:Flp pilus assembly protein CpaB [Arthrobacter sp. H14-L1]MCY0904385.1 Flp pilus assembly protein CpaB [Arthrobacter sp. H14-L1]
MKTLGQQTAPTYQGQYQGAALQPTWRHRIMRLVRRRRRFIAALLLCAATAVAVQQLAPAPVDTVVIVVAARDLAGGAMLGAADLALQRLPQDAVPAAAFRSQDSVAGRQLSGPLRKGQVLTDAALLGSGLLIGTPTGSQAVPIRLADAATVALINPGQLVNVVLSTSTGLDQTAVNQVLAEAVPVLWKPPVTGLSQDLLPGKEADGLVVVAATGDQAVKLAGASARGKLFLVLVTPADQSRATTPSAEGVGP